jgi:hypothetical protein
MTGCACAPSRCAEKGSDTIAAEGLDRQRFDGLQRGRTEIVPCEEAVGFFAFE